MKKRLKINGFIMASAVIGTVLFPTIFLRASSQSIWEGSIETLGIVFILLGQIFRISARGYKSEYSKNGNLLIQDGPYGLVRNPMYLGILLIGLGIVLALFKWWAAVIFLCVFILRYVMLIYKEEKKLLILFPGDYARYQKKVPRILPSLNALQHKDISEYLPMKPLWIKKEIGSVLAVLLATIFLESWEDIKQAGPAAYVDEAVAIIIIVALFAGLAAYLNKRTISAKNNVSNKSKITL